MVEKYFYFEIGIDKLSEIFEKTLEQFGVEDSFGSYLIDVDCQEGLISAIFHFFDQKRHILELLPKLIAKPSDSFTLNRKDE